MHTHLISLSIPPLRQAQEQLQQLRVVRRAKSSDRVPAVDSLEPFRPTARVCAVIDVVQGTRVLIQHGIDESQWPLASSKALLHDPVDQRREDGAGCRGASRSFIIAPDNNGDVITVSGYVRNASSIAVVYTAIGSVEVAAVVVVRVGRVVVLEVGVDGLLLVARNGEDVGEPLRGVSVHVLACKGSNSWSLTPPLL